MNEKTEKYFGLKFPDEVQLSHEDKHQLAKLLFISPSTGVGEVKSIISNSNLIKAITKLIVTLNCEIESVNLSSVGDDSEKSLNVSSFKRKFNKWKTEFGLPTVNELTELLSEKQIPVKGIWAEIYEQCKSEEFDTPKKHSAYLSEYVIGQEKAVKTMSVLMYEQRIKQESRKELPKNSVLLIGGTGTGKSYLVSKSREILGIPMIRINAASLVPSGIVGTTIDKYMTTLYLSTDSSLSLTSKALIFVDEVDKLSVSYHKTDEFKSTIQLELLRFFDHNEKIFFPESHKQYCDMESIPTNDLMLVFSGAFSGIENIIRERIKSENNGKLNLFDNDNILQYCTTQDIIAYGIIPELAGRLSFISPLNSLGITEIYNIITKAKDSHYVQHLNKCKVLGLNISFTEEALMNIAEKIVEQNVGVRGLNTVFNNLLTDFYYDYENYQGKKIIIDKSMLNFLLTKQQYSLLINEFELGTELTKIAKKFNADIDEILDVYLQWKKIERR